MSKILVSTLVFLAMVVASPGAGEAQDCGCTDPLDLVIMIDRSASISTGDYDDARQFARDFVRRFNVAPDVTNVGIFQFDTDAELVLDFYQGDSLANIDAATNTMSCACVDTLDFSLRPWEVPPSKPTCCARRTSISKAIERASQFLSNGLADACKAVLLITDGRDNTLSDGLTSCNGKACDTDLSGAVQGLVAAHPDVALYGAGMGKTDEAKMALFKGGRFKKFGKAGPIGCPAL